MEQTQEQSPIKQAETPDFTDVLVWNGVRRADQILRFKAFAPKIFRDIRDRFCINSQEIIVCAIIFLLTHQDSFSWGNFKTIKGEGKSGAFLLLSKDCKFIIKTATKTERNVMWTLLPSYHSVSIPQININPTVH